MDSFWSFLNTPISDRVPSPINTGLLILFIGWVLAVWTTPSHKSYKLYARTLAYTGIVGMVSIILAYLYYYQRRMRYIETFNYVNVPGEKGYVPFGNVWSSDDKRKVRHILGLVWSDKESDGEVLADEALLGWALVDRKVMPWDDNIVISSRKPKRLLGRLNSNPDTIVVDDKIYLRDDYANGKMWPYVQVIERNDDSEDQEVMFEDVKCKVPKCWRKTLYDMYGPEWATYAKTPRRCSRTYYHVNPSIQTKMDVNTLMSLYKN